MSRINLCNNTITGPQDPASQVSRVGHFGSCHYVGSVEGVRTPSSPSAPTAGPEFSLSLFKVPLEDLSILLFLHLPLTPIPLQSASCQVSDSSPTPALYVQPPTFLHCIKVNMPKVKFIIVFPKAGLLSVPLSQWHGHPSGGRQKPKSQPPLWPVQMRT
jgi:hypothetical protein